MTKRYQRGNQNLYILHLGIFWSLCCLFFFNIQILITPLVSFGHCVVCSSSMYIEEEQTTQWQKDTKGVIRICILKKNRQHNGQKIPKGWFWLPLWYLLAIVLSVLLQYTDSDYPFGIFWSLCCLSFNILILITPLVSVGHSKGVIRICILKKNRQHNGQKIPKG
jgi:hypothetical protein